ncbi:MAG TPA: class I SAM-dependent methyltransferase [bacterium]|nr:class I SAM-dependent methyltransferase [bacterium]HPN29981.1 class I SAM-dependent methyltransferase [bacterium]
MISENDVIEANKKFYDIIADKYEETDGRRGAFPKWLDLILKEISEKTGGRILIDLGTGSGWIARRASKYFSSIIAVDISFNILRNINGNIKKVNAALERLPFKNNVADAAVCFAVIHHIYNVEPLIKESGRVLKRGGAFYSDHDISADFIKYFKIPLALYRKIFAAEKKYLKIDSRLTSEMYKLSEIHSNGVECGKLEKAFKNNGFSDLKISFHWLGLTKLTDVLPGIFGRSKFFKRFAPLISASALKSK